MTAVSNNQADIALLEQRALMLGIDVLRATTAASSGHPTSALSCADIVAALFFYAMRYDPGNPRLPTNDRLILSKGHAVPIVYAAWKQVGVISDEELLFLRTVTSMLEGHPTPRFIYNEAATGSLGQGLSIGVGMALHARLNNVSYKTYVLMGDGELAEGSIWEAASLAAHYRLNNLIGIVDGNRLGQSEAVSYGHNCDRYAAIFSSFGWIARIIDGHDMSAIVQALDWAQQQQTPAVIIAKTQKGNGLAIANKEGYHGKPFKQTELDAAIKHLVAAYQLSKAPQLPLAQPQPPTPQAPFRAQATPIALDVATDPHHMLFARDKMMATRKAFGYGLAALGRQSSGVIALDADVKNSTYTELFETEHPTRFVQCYIAEQNMVGVASGLALRGSIPFAATFAAFFSRAFDQLRMAGIGRVPLRLCGSHAGVSIGEDGPSQMGLEDLAIFRSIPDSVVFYPSDAIAAYKLCAVMANYTAGITYMRTTRAETPVIYDHTTSFITGGSHVIRSSSDDQVCIITAGITLHEAIKAVGALAAEGIAASLIDLYCVKPLDIATLRRIINASKNRIVVVEDHYQAGGIGEAIAQEFIASCSAFKHLFVPTIARSGHPAELMALAGIDAKHIYDAVRDMVHAA